MHYSQKTLAALVFIGALSGSFAAAQTKPPDMNITGDLRKSMNPAARGYATQPKLGTAVPNAGGINPYSGKSVGVPLRPNDLGSPEQRVKE